ncbi:hypothetical protein ACFLRM_05945 [Acidobacteriota bacterium]
MNFKRQITTGLVLFIFSSLLVYAQEIFIYRPNLDKKPLNREKKITLHGEIFGQLLYPSNFPSYNNLSGPEDRWNYGFQNLIFLTEGTSLLAQLVTHDDGNRRTKFDWHFSIKHQLSEHLVLFFCHDSNHDSDFKSTLNGKPFFINRNYLGFSIPFKSGKLYIEPFTWFLYLTNHRAHLDLSGDKIIQESGIRVSMWLKEKISINFQLLSQSESIFSIGKAILVNLIIRVRLVDYFELSFGAGLWQDLQESPLGNQNKYYKFSYGIVFPF